MKIAFGTDEDTALTGEIIDDLRRRGHQVDVVPTGSWTGVGRTVGEAVAGGLAHRGVVCCWTGTGVSMAANKVRGARAALCTDAETARGARRWNDANVLVIGLRLTSPPVASEMVTAFLDTPADPTEAEAVSRLEG